MLRFPHADLADVALGAGTQGVARARGAGAGLVLDDDAPDVRFCVDRRGVWMTVEAGGGIHVNGRPVRRMALLRPGDAIWIDGVEVQLATAAPRAAVELPAHVDASGDARIVLRAVCGEHHGRAFSLERPRLIGRVADADIRLDAPGVQDRHARVELVDDDIVLRDLGTPDGIHVNGHRVRDVHLRPGDQLCIAPGQRFVLEAPGEIERGRDGGVGNKGGIPDAAAPVRGARARGLRLPWLLLAALLVAAALAALLLFGAH